MSNIVRSLAELLEDAYQLSLDLAYSELSPDGGCFTPRDDNFSDDDSDMIWGWADGLTHKYYFKMTEGNCSLQAMVDFDIGAFEATVKKNIEVMTNLVAKVGKPITLTVQEMKRRGYVVS